MSYKANLPRLISMINDNHLYPVEDEATRQTIFKTSSLIGGGIKKHKTQQKTENEKVLNLFNQHNSKTKLKKQNILRRMICNYNNLTSKY